MNDIDKSFLVAVDKHIRKFFVDHKGDLPESGLYKRIVSEVEVSLISNTLKATNNNQTKAAKILGMNRNTLHKKMQDLNIKT